MSNIFNLIENFVDIINNKYCLIIGVKYYNSNMNNARIMFPTDIVSHLTKVVQLMAFFQILNIFCTAFVLAIG